MKPNKLKSYLILVISVLLSGIIGYYLSSYFASPVIPILLSSTLAIILVQLFELSLTQLKQRNHLMDDTTYSSETLKVIAQLQEKLSAKNSTAKLFTLHWPTKQYIALHGGDAFSMQHSLVYASQDTPQVIDLKDPKFFSQLPEVVALDIRSLLKQYGATHAVPLCADKSVYGFVFLNIQSGVVDSEIIELTNYAGATLRQLLQHDAIISGTQSLGANKLGSLRQSVPWQSFVVLVAFVVLTSYWLSLPLIWQKADNRFLLDFGDVYVITAVWGGAWGIVVSRKFRHQRNMSRALLMFSFGLIFQVIGQLTYAAYYYFSTPPVSVPYPSLGDIGFFGSVIFYIAGVLFLANAIGITIKLHTFKNQVLAVIIPLSLLLLGYMLFLQHYQFNWADPLRIFLDFGYPLFQSIYVSIAILIFLLHLNTRGLFKQQVLIIVMALVLQFVCDYIFLYQANAGTWRVNGLNDYMYLCSYVLMTVGILQLNITYQALQKH